MNHKRLFSAAIVAVMLTTAPAYAAEGSDVKVNLKGGQLKFATEDGNFKAQIGGRIQADHALFSDDPDVGNGTEFRRTRLFFKGLSWKDWEFKSQFDFADNEVEIKDMYIAYKGAKPLTLTIGNFKGPFSLEVLTSSKYITFMERSMVVNTFVPSRNFGIGLKTYRGGLTVGVALHAGNEKYSEENYGVAARGTYTHKLRKDGFIHGGASVSYFSHPGEGGTERVRQRYGAHITDFRPASINQWQVETNTSAGISTSTPIADGQSITSVDSVYAVGIEGALVYRNFSLQGEYIMADYDSGDFDSGEGEGFYVQGSIFLTPGDRRAYKGSSAAFSGVKPKAPFGRDGGLGAWELAVRYDSLDLSDIRDTADGGTGINCAVLNRTCTTHWQGSEVDVFTIGINWYLNSNVRFTANYVDVLSADVAGPNTIAEPSVAQFRAQVAF